MNATINLMPRVGALVLLLFSFFLLSSAFALQDEGIESQQSSQPDLQSESDGPLTSDANLPSPSSGQSADFSRTARVMASFTVFVLAIFVGFEVITKVPPTLHTPLMSGSNAISGITVVGALLAAGHAVGGFGAFLGLVALLLASINVIGGFLVTRRMLMMFKKR